MEYEKLARIARETDAAGRRTWVTFESDEGDTIVGHVVDVSSVDGGRVRVRDFPVGEMWSMPVGRVSTTAPPPPAIGAPLTVETMTEALKGGRRPWVTWEDCGVTYRGTAVGFLADEDGLVRVYQGSQPISIMVGRLTLELRASTPTPDVEAQLTRERDEARHDRDVARAQLRASDLHGRAHQRAVEWTAERALEVVRAGHVVDRDRAHGSWVVIMSGAPDDSHPARPQLADRELRDVLDVLADEQMIMPAAEGEPWREVRPSDHLPTITHPTAPVNAAGARWVPPDAYDTAIRERDDAVADATRSRRLLWTLLRGLAISESQAAAWLSLLLDEPPTG